MAPQPVRVCELRGKPGKTDVTELGGQVIVEENIGRFEVPMEDRLRDGLSNSNSVCKRFTGAKRGKADSLAQASGITWCRTSKAVAISAAIRTLSCHSIGGDSGLRWHRASSRLPPCSWTKETQASGRIDWDV